MGAGPLLDEVLTDHDAFQAAVPHEYFRQLREHDPVHWTPEPSGRGFWSVTRHADIVAVSRDFSTYSSQLGASALEDLEPDALEARASMIDLDPPAHTVLRQSVNGPFTRRAVTAYTDGIVEIVDECLDAIARAGTFDVVEDLAVRVPIRVLCRILGVPIGDEHHLVTLGDRLIANTDPDLTEVLFDSADSQDYRLLPFRNPAALEMHAYGRALAEQRRARPLGDLVSSLVTPGARAALEGRDFDAMFLLLVVAGNETTRSAIALSLQTLMAQPQHWETLRSADDEALDRAVEELLRWTTPLHHFRRTATRATSLSGVEIAAGDKVVVWYSSGNRDERAFTDPDRLDLTRRDNPQLSFGRGGPHRCVGEHLARLELKIVLRHLVDRFDRLEPHGPGRRVRSNFVNGLKSLPARALPRG